MPILLCQGAKTAAVRVDQEMINGKVKALLPEY